MSNLVSYLPPSSESKKLLNTLDSEIPSKTNISKNVNTKYNEIEAQRLYN